MRGRALSFGAVNLAFAWLAIGIATVPWWPVYADPRFLLAVSGAVFLASIPSVLGAILRWPSWVVLVASAVLFFASGVQLAIPSESTAGGLLPTLPGLGDLAAGTALGWRQLLTITIPVGSYQTLLVPLYFSVFAATAASVSLSLRLRRGELGAIPVLLLFAAGVIFGPSTAVLPAIVALAEVSAVLLWVAWREQLRRRARARRSSDLAADRSVRRNEAVGAARSFALAAVVVAVAVGASLVAVQQAPLGRDRVVLRTVVQQPFDPRNYPSPLSGFRAYLEAGRASETVLRLSRLPEGGRIRIATLDSYDGVVYAVGSGSVDSASGTFTRVPTTVDQSRTDGTRVDVGVQIAAYRGVWLPTVGDLEQIRFTGSDAVRARNSFYYNATSGTGAVLGGVRAGDDYSTVAILPTARTLTSLSSATPGAASLPDVSAYPDGVSVRLQSYSSGIAGRGGQLVAAIEGLRRDGYISHGLLPTEPTSRSGHSSDRITELLTGQRMIGDAEQYSVAAALMARELGFPARVVYGFAPSTSGTVDVTGKDVSAWIEVYTAQWGWVTIDPVPPVRPIPDALPQQPTQITRPQTPVQPPPDEPQVRQRDTPPSSTQSDTKTDGALVALIAGLRVSGIVLAVAGLIALPLIVIAATKSIRRRRRRGRGAPVTRIAGAWAEFRDEAVDYGLATPGSLTRSEFADSTGLAQSQTLAAVVDRAVFAPDAPGLADADRVWIALDEISDSLGRGLTRRHRIRARLSLRSLRRRARG